MGAIIILLLLLVVWGIKGIFDVCKFCNHIIESKKARTQAMEFIERFCDKELEKSIRERMRSSQEERDKIWNEVYEVISSFEHWGYFTKERFDKWGEDLAVAVIMTKNDKIMELMTGDWYSEALTMGHLFFKDYRAEKAGMEIMKYIGEHFVRIDPSLKLLVNNITMSARYFWTKSMLTVPIKGHVLVSSDIIKYNGAKKAAC